MIDEADIPDTRTTAEIVMAEGCAGCMALAVEVFAMQRDMAEAREQGAAMAAKLPKPMRRMLGIED